MILSCEKNAFGPCIIKSDFWQPAMGGVYSFMNATLEQVSEFLEDKDLQFAITSDGESILLPCGGERLQWTTTISVSEQGNCLSFVSRLPTKIPQNLRSEAAKAIAKLNFGRRLGAFHLDLSDGEVLYCMSHILDGEDLEEEILEMLVGVTYVSMDGSGPELLKLGLEGFVSQDVSPSDDPDRSSSRRMELN
jgi:hypothetical protein